MRIKHWLPCGAGGRAVYGHVIIKFSGMGRFTYPWCSAGGLRPPELRYESVEFVIFGNKTRVSVRRGSTVLRRVSLR